MSTATALSNVVLTSDNRQGRVFLYTGNGDALQESYNIDSSELYIPVDRHLSLKQEEDTNYVSVSLKTSSVFCPGDYPNTILRFSSEGDIASSYDVSIQAQAIIAEQISMGFRVENLPLGKALYVRLSGGVDSPATGVKIKFSDSKGKVYAFDTRSFNQEIQLYEGEHCLTSAYNLNMNFPGDDPLSSCPILTWAQLDVLGVK